MPPMRITSRGLAAATVGLVSAVVLAGCSSNSTKPTVLPSLQTTSTAPTSAAATTPGPVTSAAVTAPPPSETATASPAPVSTSKAISATTPPGDPALVAEGTAFVRDYYETAAKALHDKASLVRWRSLFTPSCSVCTGDYTAVSNALAAGDRYQGGEYRLKSTKVRIVSTDGALVDVTFYVTAAKVFDSQGHLIVQQAQTKLSHGTVGASRTAGHWLITQIHDDSA
ncbi:MAG: hypothetical protein QOJ11_2017 [Frankiales bacterium]|jgi:hypothetical protein|nr:hypothetical protein [Frankiales bacterium]